MTSIEEMQKLALYELLTFISNKAQIHSFMTIIYKMVENLAQYC